MQTNKTTKQIIAENSKWFDFYLVLPKIFTIIIGCVFFIGGIVGMGILASFGRDFVSKGMICMLGLWVGGATVCAAFYFLLKLSLSYKILHIYYLKKLVGVKGNINNTESIDNSIQIPEVTEDIDEFPEI